VGPIVVVGGWGDRGVSTKILAAVGIAAIVTVTIGILGLTSLRTVMTTVEVSRSVVAAGAEEMDASGREIAST
jgi:hypothetical protein